MPGWCCQWRSYSGCAAPHRTVVPPRQAGLLHLAHCQPSSGGFPVTPVLVPRSLPQRRPLSSTRPLFLPSTPPAHPPEKSAGRWVPVVPPISPIFHARPTPPSLCPFVCLFITLTSSPRVSGRFFFFFSFLVRQMAALSHPLTTAADKPPPEAPKEPQLSFPTAANLHHKHHHHQQQHYHQHHHRSSISRSSISVSERPPNDHLPAGSSSQRPAHTSTPSTGSLSTKSQRSSSLLNRAAAAFDRTQIAIASFSEPVIRPRQSNSALARLSLAPASPVTNSEPASPERNPNLRASSSQSLASSLKVDARQLAHAASAKDPPSQPYSETDPGHPAPIKLPAPDNKMHQTSSRLLRMTDDDRPFTRVCDLNPVSNSAWSGCGRVPACVRECVCLLVARFLHMSLNQHASRRTLPKTQLRHRSLTSSSFC